MSIRTIQDPINSIQLENVNYNFGFLFNYLRSLSGGNEIGDLINRINQALVDGQNIQNTAQGLIDELTPLLNELNEAISEVGELKYSGVWNDSENYKTLNIVSYDGSSYIARQDNSNITPSEGEIWGVISQRGQQGIRGEKGDTGRGLIILGLVANVSDLPATANDGDAYLVEGTNTNNLYVWIDNQFVDVGPFGNSGLSKATQTQAVEGTDDEAYMTPLRVNDVTGTISNLQTNEKSNLVGATNELKNDLDSFFGQYEYQTAVVSSRTIQLNAPSNSRRLPFILNDSIETGTTINVSVDNGTTSLPLRNFDGTDVTQLDAGLLEVLAEATFFTLVSKKGISQSDLQPLINVANEYESNEQTLRQAYVNTINALYPNANLNNDSSFNDILNYLNTLIP